MRNRIVVAAGALTLIILLWVGYTFGVKPTITIQTDGSVNVTVTSASSGNTVYDGQDKSVRVDPGSYIVRATTGLKGVSKQVDLNPFGSVSITLPQSSLLQASLIAPVSLYQPVPAGSSYIGFDPKDSLIKRLTPAGEISQHLTPAFDNPDADVDLPNPATDYQPYQHNQVIAAFERQLYAIDSSGPREINTAGIVPKDDQVRSTFIVATQPQSAAFVVAYKHDVYWYDNTSSAPKKIYTAKHDFDRLVYGGHTVGIYDTRIPPSKQDLKQFYPDYQYDLLLIDTANNNTEQTVAGPLAEVTINPDGSKATIHPRTGQPYIYDVTKKQMANNIDLPLVAGPYWTSNTSYVFAQDAAVWQYDTSARQSTLIGVLPASATAFYMDDSGAFTVSTYTTSGNAALYRLGKPTPESELNDKLRSALPYNDENINITFANVSGKPTVTILTKAPLNSANQLDRWRRDTTTYRQQAVNYLISQKIDPTTVTIVYSPADPL